MPDSPQTGRLSVLHRALAERACGDPARRTLLVGRRGSEGRELLRALALRGRGWAGVTVRTPLAVAGELVADRLAREGLRVADEVEQQAVVDHAVDRALDEPDLGKYRRLGDGTGFRERMRGAVEALRTAGVSADRLATRGPDGAAGEDAAPGPSPMSPARWRLLARVLRGYEERLAEEGWCDNAAVLGRAAERLREDPDPLPYDRVLLLPGQNERGRRGELLSALRARGGRVLETDPVRGLEPPAGVTWREGASAESPLSGVHGPGPPDGTSGTPRSASAGGSEPRVGDGGDAPGPEPVATVDLFSAASPLDEIREVLRRVSATGRHWDEVEIVAADPVAHGSALEVLASRLEIPVSYAVGLPVERTRPGRAVAAYLRWLEEDFPSEIPRRLLRSGQLEAPSPGDRTDGARLARRLRNLRVGWGRDRYRDVLEHRIRALESEPLPEGPEDADDPDLAEGEAARRARELAELRALRDLLLGILDRTPPTPGRVEREDAATSPAALARGVLAFLEHVPAETPVEEEAAARLGERLERIVALEERGLDRETDFDAARAVLRSHLEIRVPAPRPVRWEEDGEEGPRLRSPPWSSAGGHLHLSDLAHGGLTGRPLTFVVGLDARQFPGAGLQHPILPDRARRTLAPGDLPTSGEEVAERRFRLAALLARLRGRVTLSYSAWEPSEGRSVPPASVLLQALRVREGDPDLDFEDFHAALGRPACPLPRDGGRIDRTDVWLDALAEDGLLLLGEEQARAAFPHLDRGLAAQAARAAPGAGPHRGVVEPRPERLDPRGHAEMVVSASRLETLGRCPLAYLYRYGLEIRAPDDPELDPTAWLDARERGVLLHRVYEETLRGARDGAIAPGEDAFAALAREVLSEEAERMLRRVPPPSEFVRRREMRALERDLEAFVQMVRGDPPNVVALELEFGFPGSDLRPVELDVPGGTLRVLGRVDRVDELPDGRLRVVDYKTGRPHRGGEDPFEGGRRLQHLLYMRAVESIEGRDVAAMEYHFPTVRGEARAVTYRRADLRQGDDVLSRLLDQARRGRFLPTDDADDCRWCDFREICRVRVEKFPGYSRVHSPPAEWAEAHAADLPEYGDLLRLRGRT